MESSLAFMDDLLDFSSDIGEEDEEDDAVPPKSSSTAAPAATDSSELNAAFHPEDSSSCRVLPEEDYAEEEELEWLSNEDAFPAVETFVGILSDHHHHHHHHPPPPPSVLTSVSKQNSPVSVLETSSISSNGETNSSGKSSAHGSILMSCCGGLKVPGKARSKRRRGRQISGHHLWFKQQQPSSRSVKQVLPTTAVVATETTAARTAAIGRKCLHCGAEKTPQWRAGPLGPKTLCNACGVRFKSGRLVPEYRPASSPTFSPEMHSNSHRKVVEMRRQKQLGMVVNPMDKG